tara:strand:- start:1362 stop:2141 length:780 start_codon:yes stop_codon:yes gene_type:complete
MNKSKNIVFMMDIDLKGDGRYSSARRKPYEYSISSWKKWCEKNNCELFVLNDLIVDKARMSICWQRYYLFDLLESNNINYKQILMVDSDTLVHPETPNFFNLTDNKYVGVHNEGSYDWILRSIENYSKYIFNGKMINWWEYINGGFQIVNKSHKKFFQDVVSFYFQNEGNLINMQETFHVGTDQTPINFLLNEHDIDVKLLSYSFNMCDMFSKEILDEQLTFTNVGWIYHFNAIPNNSDAKATLYWMSKAYKYFYGNLK